MTWSADFVCRAQGSRVPPAYPSMNGEILKIRVRRLKHSEGLPLPDYSSPGSSGLDLRACVENEVEIQPGESMLIPTGFCLEIPPGHEGQVRPRSGLALGKRITVLNSPGTIDSDYRGEVSVILVNHSSIPFKVSRGDRIAQLVFCKVSRAALEESEDLERTSRGEGGFGHTGI
jgi:dUTP pyrophosphatase